MLREAQGLVGDRNLVYPDRLAKWANEDRFTTEASNSQRVHINGHVDGGDAKTREEQKAILTERGLSMASLEDLAAAFVAHYIATKEPLFGFYKDNNYTFLVRAAGGALSFYSVGLDGNDSNVDYRDGDVAVAAALPRLRSIGASGVQAGIKT